MIALPAFLSAAALAVAPDANDSAEKAGMWVGTLLFSSPAIWAAVKAWRATTASMRLAAIACGLGVLVFISPHMLASWNPVDHRAAWMIAGGLKLLCGAGGLVCAILALVLRKRDNGVGLALPIIGGAFAGLHLLYGLCLALAPLLMASNVGTPWTLKLPDGPAAITFPSKQWQSAPGKKGGMIFVNRVARGKGLVFCEQADEAAFAQMKALLKELADKDTSRQEPPACEEGALPSGAKYVYVTVRSRHPSGKGEFITGVLKAWHPGKGLAVTVVYEGLVDALSDTMTTAQTVGHREAARRICMSVEFEPAGGR